MSERRSIPHLSTREASRHTGRCSIVIPAYNVAAFVDAAIESALAQTYGDTEVIVVDDGSTDATSERIDSFASEVTVVRQTNQGLSAARNAGILRATGDVIGLLDGDDLWLPNRVERCREVLDEHSDVGFVTSDAWIIDERGQPTGDRFFHGQRTFPTDRHAEHIVARNFMFVGALIRRSELERVGLFDERLRAGCEDYDLWLRLVAAGSAPALVGEPLAHYRVRSGSMTQSQDRIAAARLEVLERRLPAFWRQGIYGPASQAWAIGSAAFERGDRRQAARFYFAAVRGPGKSPMSRAKTAAKAIVTLSTRRSRRGTSTRGTAR